MKKITAQQILYIMPHAANYVGRYIDFINRFAEEFEINTPLRMAHYLAQVAHESGELRYAEEIASGKEYDTGRKAQMLGNTPEADGDGQRYKGRGLLQITGRANYTAYKNYCGYDVVAQPELLAKPLGAVRSSMWVFWKFGCLELADQDNLHAIRRKINGGYNGLKECEEYIVRAKRALNIFD